MLKELLKPDIEELIEEKRWRELKEIIVEWNPAEVADLLRELKTSWRVILFRTLPRKFADEVFSYLEPKEQQSLLVELTDNETLRIVEEMDPDDRTALFEELPGEAVQRLIAGLTKEEREKATTLLGYPEDSVGRLMTPDYLTVKSNWTREEALEHIRKYGKECETIDIIYVTGNKDKLVDDLLLREVIFAEPGETIENLLDGNFVTLSPYDDQEKAVEVMGKYDYSVLPVVDSDGILLGIVTFDDILDVSEEEATEDIQKIASVVPLEKSYRESTIWQLYSKRIVWLAILVPASLISTRIIAHFSYAISAITALTFFIPLLIDTGGNTSSQIATITIRALATGELRRKEWWRALAKEFLVGSLLAISLGILIIIMTATWQTISLQFSLMLGLSMLFIVIWANILGLLLPLILTAIKLDPAMASSPLLTTIMDISGLTIYFLVATKILGL